MSRGQAGFTLLELIVAITITSILAAMTVPSYLSSVRSNRGVSDANGILGVITLARNEAIRRDTNVTICPYADSTGATLSCTTTGTWDQGYVLFVGNGTTFASSNVLRMESPLSGSSTISLCSGTPSSSNTAAYTLTFAGTGQTTAQAYFDINPTTKTGTACPSSTAAKVNGERYVVVRQIGRANVCDPTDSKCGQ